MPLEGGDISRLLAVEDECLGRGYVVYLQLKMSDPHEAGATNFYIADVLREQRRGGKMETAVQPGKE